MPEYAVSVKIKNGPQPVKYDVAVGAFIPSEGKPLVIPTYAYTKEFEQNNYQVPDQLKPIILQPNEIKVYSFQTNGYTLDLLNDVGRYPLQFAFSLVYKEEIVAGPFHAKLPSLKDLPQAEMAAYHAQEIKGQPLKFMKP